jgi:cell fate (sporulation/competence/biofilm development) regulator YlbF (YheA/YmcA/DUF963 family)
MKTELTTLPPPLVEAIETLAAALLNTEPLAAYRQAAAALEAEPDSMTLLNQFSAAQAEVRKRQGNGTVTQFHLDRLRSLQRQVQANSAIMNYASAQQSALAYLPEVNLEISQLIGMDFAALAGPSGCC